MKKYRLLKDLPDLKKGAIFKKDDIDYLICYETQNERGSNVVFEKEYIKDFDEWFEEIEEEEKNCIDCRFGNECADCNNYNQWQPKKEEEKLICNTAECLYFKEENKCIYCKKIITGNAIVNPKNKIICFDCFDDYEREIKEENKIEKLKIANSKI